MTLSVSTNPELMSRFVNGILAIEPLAKFAKHQARSMMIKRAEKIGVPWRQQVELLRSQDWETRLAQVNNAQLIYPEYYLRSFHAYDAGNLSWEAAFEVEVAARAVHAGIWPGAGINGDAKLRQSYHDLVLPQLDTTPQDILDLGCSVGMSTFALQDLYPQTKVTGVDLSPYFLAVAQHRSTEENRSINWVHAAAEDTKLQASSFDLVSICLVCHELPQLASRQVFQEARRLLRQGGYLTIMDMNPKSQVYATMPPYILTLLKSTEPYLDEYFSLDIEQALVEAGFERPNITPNSPRHRTIVAKVG
jgi:ubiquinone/menaquinone biosynthesis C-methylase UbiE